MAKWFVQLTKVRNEQTFYVYLEGSNVMDSDTHGATTPIDISTCGSVGRTIARGGLATYRVPKSTGESALTLGF